MLVNPVRVFTDIFGIKPQDIGATIPLGAKAVESRDVLNKLLDIKAFKEAVHTKLHDVAA